MLNSGKWIDLQEGDWHYYFCGFFWLGSKKYDGVEALNLLKDKNAESLKNLLRSADGNFCMLVIGKGRVVLAVDRLRSIPLFYYIDKSDVYVSDDGWWVIQQSRLSEIDAEAALEYLATGYVTGNGTLVKGLMQVQAGEIVEITDEGGELQLKSVRYYMFRHEVAVNKSQRELETELLEVLDGVFSRLVIDLGGRTAIIPLSGGRDSRLIATMLKRYNYGNVICFSYGLPNNQESLVSRQVAECLGYRWLFVPYSNEKWKNWYHSEDFTSYARFCNSFAAIPHMQDWPAVRELHLHQLIPSDSVFLPGHSGDFLAGSHITQIYQKLGAVSGIENLVKAILDFHYVLCRYSNESRGIFAERIKAELPSNKVQSFDELCDLFELWDWQERQAKFIVNSVRVYEFWGYEWRIPLWDNQLMDFFSGVPLKLRLEKKLYDLVVDRVYGAFCNERANMLDISSIKRLIKRFPALYRFLSAAKSSIRPRDLKAIYESHPLGFYGIWDFSEFKKVFIGNNNVVNAMVAIDQLEEIKSNLGDG